MNILLSVLISIIIMPWLFLIYESTSAEGRGGGSPSASARAVEVWYEWWVTFNHYNTFQLKLLGTSLLYHTCIFSDRSLVLIFMTLLVNIGPFVSILNRSLISNNVSSYILVVCAAV